jgi:hypothetical protein
MKIVKERKRIKSVYYRRVFWNDQSLSGFSFDCDAKGNVDTNKLAIVARQNFHKCLAGGFPELTDRGAVRYKHVYTEPAVGLCDRCSQEVVLSGFTNTCECRADYNITGELLAPRSQWGEDTGESLADILNIP